MWESLITMEQRTENSMGQILRKEAGSGRRNG